MSRKSTGERQEEILDVSLEILHEEGHSALTVRNIAERIGVSEPAIYRHFEDKEEIIYGLARKVFSEDRLPEDVRTDDLEKMIRDMISGIFGSLENSPETTAMIFHGELFSQYPRVREIFIEHRQDKKEKFKEMLEMAKERGILKEESDPEYLSTIMMGSIRMTVLEWRDNDFEYDIGEKAEPLAKELSGLAGN